MIRLKRFGRRNRPSWRIAVMDKRNARDGESIEEIGTYDNVTDPKQTKVVVKADRARYWLSVGAQPSRMVHHISVSYTHLRAHETPEHLVCRLLLEKKKK